MIFIIGAIALSLLNLIVGFLALSRIHVSEYLDISLVCYELKDTPDICINGATEAGLVALIGLVIVLIVSLLIVRDLRANNSEKDIKPLRHDALLPIVMAGTTLIYAIYVLGDMFGTHSVSRIDAIANQSSVISLGNLIWPLLLQLANSSSTMRYRLSYLSLALLILCFSPFRGVLLGVIAFGLLIPLCQVYLSGSKKVNAKIGFLHHRSFNIGVIFILISVTIVGIFYQTKSREMNSSQGEKQHIVVHHLTQRLAYPLFQAYFAGRLAELEPLPTMVDDMAAKLRISSSVNLNEYLYQRIYSYGSVGQMTSLYYGEATANSNAHPLVWATVAPLALIMLWIIFRKVGYEIGTLIGIALWRSSLGGLGAMLPALVIQIAFVILGTMVIAKQPYKLKEAS